MRRKQVDTRVSSKPGPVASSTVAGLWPDADPPHRFLTVRSKGRDRPVPLSELDAIIDCPPISSVPAAPRWLLGVAAYRGALLSVVDLATACGDSTETDDKAGDRLLLVESGIQRIGFSVDAILNNERDDHGVNGTPLALRALAAKLLSSESTRRRHQPIEPESR